MIRRVVSGLARARSVAGDLALVAICLVLLPGLAVTALAFAEAVLLEPPASTVFPLLLLPLGLCAIAGGALLLLAAREQARTAQNQAAFIAQRAHDIKTPIATLRCLLEMRNPGSLDSEEAAVGRSALTALEGQVRDLLGWGRLAAGRASYTLRPVRLGEVVEESLRRVRGLTIPRGQEIVVSSDPAAENVELLADEEALISVLTNLLANASKYGPPGTPIELTADASASTVALAVHDRGPGISERERNRVFRMFYRGEGAAGVEGIGLGLAIVAAAVHAHGGTVEVTPRQGGGSTFSVQLPTRASLESAP